MFRVAEKKRLGTNDLESHKSSVRVFTNGSKSDAGVGFGLYFLILTTVALYQVMLLYLHTSELYGILTALKRIVHCEHCSYTIFSDSKSVLEALGSFNPVHPLVLEILEWLFLLSCKQKVVQFCWVPAHVGILSNEKSDQLTKKGSLKQPMKKGIPHSDYILGVRESISFTWQFAWNLELSNKIS